MAEAAEIALGGIVIELSWVGCVQMVVDEERDKRGGQNRAHQILHKLFLIQKKKALSDSKLF